MFTTFPKTKTYFSHLDINPNSDHLRCHGKKIVQALAEGARNISTLATTLAPLSRFHAYLLRIHPTNFKVLMKLIQFTSTGFILIRDVMLCGVFSFNSLT
ncbi:hemoglobin subunit alpha [Pimephales promelas]|nr:hemoglobin subunit alpha [Pimephales promelas]